MKSRKDLMEQYEDAMFSVMMDEIMSEEGRELLKENERLKADPDFVIPEEVDRRSLKTIARYFSKQKRTRAAHAVWRVFQRISVAAFTAMLLFTGIYAVSPEVRSVTLNLLIEVSDVATSMSFEEGNIAMSTSGKEDLLPYEFAEVPEGFTLTETGGDRFSGWKTYMGENDAKIMLEVTNGSENMLHQFDTENADNVEDIELDGHGGLLVEKGERIRAVLIDEENQIFVDIICDGVSMEEALNVIFSVTYTGQEF